ncbi:Slx4p interacting protein [Physocladia obscura]|uniref:Slx4p interacting protein n=1 Tax=Physocladia obscura TaxID=109957 RepID=A0AAD5SNC1_9FUNG|nr:Slx4p interacting protein [Physocladia obscura]
MTTNNNNHTNTSTTVFYACYLLQSLAKQNKCYVGSTPDPIRRIRQHNGLIQGGAKKTASARPWQMVLVVHGFPSNTAALQFEWAWQKPHESRHLRDKGYSRAPAHASLTTKLRVLADMLHVRPWSRWALSVHATNSDIAVRLNTTVAQAQRAQFQAQVQAQLSKPCVVSVGSLQDLPFRNALSSDITQAFESVFLHNNAKCSVCSHPIDSDQQAKLSGGSGGSRYQMYQDEDHDNNDEHDENDNNDSDDTDESE